MGMYKVLGSLSVTRAGADVEIPTRMLRRLLGLLLSQANRPMSMDAIVDALWNGAAPRTARKTLIVYISRLRQLIGSERIRQELDGYLLVASAGELDAATFDTLMDEAVAATSRGESDVAADRLTRALRMWRGAAYLESSDIALVAGEASRLEERRVDAIEEMAAVDLDRGRPAEVVAALRPVVVDHPYRERLRSLLMTALHRAGRSAEALEQYRQFRQLLADELGLDPSAALQRLHHQILTDDQQLGAATPWTTRRYLPRRVPTFVGRDADLAWLDRAAFESTAPILVTALAGTAGIGKTALAVRWAHGAANRFPDGQLYVDLRGYGPGRPMSSIEALHHLLRCLGAPPAQLHVEVDAAAATYRALLAGRRMLILLDNAATADQVRPLLPAERNCVIVITSRDKLSGLIALDGAQRITLDLLTATEALELLRRILGEERVTRELDEAQRLIELCGRLPLALRIAAAHLADLPDEPIQRYVDALSRADVVSVLRVDGDEHRGLDAVLARSYQVLSEEARRVFRHLGLHPAQDIGLAAVASLTGLEQSQVRPALDELVEVHLLAQTPEGRYTFHDVLRAYAAARARQDEDAADRNSARIRLLDHYLHTAYAADRLLHPVRRRVVTLDPAAPGVAPEPIEDWAAAVAWFTAELATLRSFLRHVHDSRLDAYTWRLAWVCDTTLDWQGYWQDFLSSNENALAATERLGDVSGHAYANNGVARASIRLHRYDEALHRMRRALQLLGQVGDRIGQGNTYVLMSVLFQQQGRDAEALDHALSALGHFDDADAATRARGLNATAWARLRLGDHRAAIALCQQALHLLRDIDDRDNLAATWDTAGLAHHQLGDYREAADCYARAIAVYQAIGNRYYWACSLDHVGDSHLAAGDAAAARTAWQQAIAILVDLDHPDVEAVQAKLHRSDRVTAPAQ